MTWNCTRKATREELDAVRVAAERFCKRHGIHYVLPHLTAETAIEAMISARTSYLHDEQLKYLRSRWRTVLKRLTGSADGIAYGHVGHPQD